MGWGGAAGAPCGGAAGASCLQPPALRLLSTGRHVPGMLLQ